MDCVSIIPSTHDHIVELAKMVRPEDRDELMAASNHSPEQAMEAGLLYSDQAMTGFIDGVPVCMWGVVRESLIMNMGVPWMVATSLLDKRAATFLRHCRGPVMAMLGDYDTLINHVDARNTKAIKWLKWLGFKVEEEAVEYGVEKLPFHRFSMSGGKNV